MDDKREAYIEARAYLSSHAVPYSPEKQFLLKL